MKKKISLALALMIVSALLFSACGSAEEQAVEEPVSEVAEVEEEVQEPVNIGVYSVSWSASSINMMQELIEKFNAEHEGEIVAEYVQGGWGEADSYVTAGVSGGGGIADVIEFSLGGALAWYDQGYTLDLSPYITDEIRATMPEILWDARTAEDGGVFFSGTITGSHTLLYYNPALLEAAGIAIPAEGETWTWEEFLENAKLLTVDANGKHVGEDGFDTAAVVQWGFLPRLDNEKIWEEAAEYAMQASHKPMIRMGDDGVWDIFFDDEALPVLESYFSLISSGVTPEKAIGLTGSSQDEAFFQGEAALVQRAYFNVAVLHDNYPDFEFGVMPIPMEENSLYYQSTDGQGFAIPASTENPEAAAEFVFWMQKPENQALWSSALMLSPCNPEAFNDPLIADNPEFGAMRFYKTIEEIVSVDINSNQDEFVTTVYAPAMMEVLMGNKTLSDAIAEIKSVSVDVLNQ